MRQPLSATELRELIYAKYGKTYDYMDKLDGVAYLVGALGQTDKVRAFLKAPARSQKGMPPRPVVGTAISIRFDLEPGVVEEWFGNGYQ
ncbi:hypothetical protein GPECTOR_1g920 [Gonium pectorale]|uniref:Uncharacterized protein n=1 Tax=Gonium pectorale TaxID=33097 RepID=A0A150H4G1_GONPE|nr:hypothetical protein GPECTOR_1g920 [Gonium pectorale]|eukprot:KXZ57019.1 hypothetical protein GPECTOR_1g920 [Gonium pectorale]